MSRRNYGMRKHSEDPPAIGRQITTHHRRRGRKLLAEAHRVTHHQRAIRGVRKDGTRIVRGAPIPDPRLEATH